MSNQSMYAPAIAVLLVGVLGFAPLGQAEQRDTPAGIAELKKESRDLLQALKSYSVEQRDEAITESRAVLDDLDKRIDTLERRLRENWNSMSEQARRKTGDKLRALRRERTRVAEWYGSLKNSSGEAWEHMKQGFSEAYRDLYEAWQRSEDAFRNSQ